MDRAAYIVHPTASGDRCFVGDDLSEAVELLSDRMDVYALTQSGYDDELVGEDFYTDTFADLNGGGKMPSGLLDELVSRDEIYVGGGRSTDCVPQSLRSLAFRDVPRDMITVGEEVTYDIVEGGPVSVEEMMERGDVDADEHLSRVYNMARVEPVL